MTDAKQPSLPALIDEVISREARRLQILRWLEDQIGTAWICDRCGHSTYNSYSNECADCGQEFPTLHLIAFKLHAGACDDPQIIAEVRAARLSLSQSHKED